MEYLLFQNSLCKKKAYGKLLSLKSYFLLLSYLKKKLIPFYWRMLAIREPLHLYGVLHSESFNELSAIYRVSRYLVRPLHSITGQCQTPNLYIFLIPHQFQIYMQDFRSPTWFTYFRWHNLWCGILWLWWASSHFN